MADSLKLVLKCIDKDGFGNLYALNQKLDDETLETVKDYFHNYQLEDYKDIMEIFKTIHNSFKLHEKSRTKTQSKPIQLCNI